MSRYVLLLAGAIVVTIAVFIAISGRDEAKAESRFLPITAQAGQDTAPENLSADQQLADRYAPVVYLRQVNNDICSTQNEGFDPVPVDFVLGRDEIPLLVSTNGSPTGPREIVADPPRASDLYGLGPGNFLDYPGSPVSPGCTYRRYFANRAATEDIPHVAYAHIYQEPGSDELALQYWMFYYFNDWNNNHEGDWEMIMLFFDADTAEEALGQEPTRVVYAQHGGGERADWDDEKLSKEDGHPVVYVARGAHASMFESYTYLGLAENGTGFGCETTKGPHRRYELDAVVVPHAPSGPDDPFAWLAFDGRWGEFRRSEWNGPTGPNDKTAWEQPVSWGDRTRDTSLIVPEFEGFGESPIELFCGIVSGGSRVLVAFTRAPALGIGILGIAVVVGAWVTTYSTSTIRQALAYYRRHFRTFGLIGVALIPTGYLVAALQTLLFRVPPIEPFLAIMDRFPGIRIALALALGSLQATLAVVFVTPTIIWTMSQIRRGHTPSVVESYRHGVRAIRHIFVARVRVAVPIVLYAITIVGLPWAVLRLARAIFIAQAVVHDEDEPLPAIEDSAAAANVDLSRTVVSQVVFSVITYLTGPLLAIFLLLAIPSRPLSLVNYVSSLIFTFLYPLGIIGMTLLYFELRADPRRALTPEVQEPATAFQTEAL
jgi:uncharacterized membrane protein YdcZ (DUF606 family)